MPLSVHVCTVRLGALAGLLTACSPSSGATTTDTTPTPSTDVGTTDAPDTTGVAATTGASETPTTAGDTTGPATDPDSAGTTVDPPDPGSTGSGTTDPGTADSGTADTGTADTGTDDTTGGAGLADLGALVVLGDSISDGGGQSPFYYDLLRADLEAKYGPLAYEREAQSGSKTSALPGQAKALPKQLPGPVAVCITSGGNDMKGALPQVIVGLDGPIKQQVAANIDAALGELLAPGRFGDGVEVFVFEANIYDASDGVGDFGAHDCAFGDGLPPIETDPFFTAWNGTIADAVLARAQTPVDLHGHFYGHGFNNPPNWYAPDCTHPSKLGHDQLRRLFYQHITGEALP